jgi:hypothetical protein
MLLLRRNDLVHGEASCTYEEHQYSHYVLLSRPNASACNFNVYPAKELPHVLPCYLCGSWQRRLVVHLVWSSGLLHAQMPVPMTNDLVVVQSLPIQAAHAPLNALPGIT